MDSGFSLREPRNDGKIEGGDKLHSLPSLILQGCLAGKNNSTVPLGLFMHLH
jgi:hypothetical protein